MRAALRADLGRRLVQESGLLIAFIVAFAIFAATAPNFTTELNLLNILRQAVFAGIIAMGMTLVIVAAETSAWAPTWRLEVPPIGHGRRPGRVSQR